VITIHFFVLTSSGIIASMFKNEVLTAREGRAGFFHTLTPADFAFLLLPARAIKLPQIVCGSFLLQTGLAF